MNRLFWALVAAAPFTCAVAQSPASSQPLLPEGSVKATDRQFRRLFVEAVPVMPGERIRLSFSGRIDGNHRYWNQEVCKSFLGVKYDCHDVLRDGAQYHAQQSVPVLVRISASPEDQGEPVRTFLPFEPIADFTETAEPYLAAIDGGPTATTIVLNLATPEKKHAALSEFIKPGYLSARISGRIGKGGAPMTATPCPLRSPGTCSSGAIAAKFDIREDDVAPRVTWMREYLAGARREIVAPLVNGFLIDRLLAQFDGPRSEAVKIVFAHAERHYTANDESRRQILDTLNKLAPENNDVLTALANWYLSNGDFTTAIGLNKQNIDRNKAAYENATGKAKYEAAVAYAQALSTQSKIDTTRDSKLRGRAVIGAIGLAERSAALYQEAACNSASRDSKLERNIAASYQTVAELRRALGGQPDLDAAESNLRRAREWIPRTEKGRLISVTPSGRWALLQSPDENSLKDPLAWEVRPINVPPMGSRVVAHSLGLEAVVAKVSDGRFNFWDGKQVREVGSAAEPKVREIVGVTATSVLLVDESGSLRLWNSDQSSRQIAVGVDRGAVFDAQTGHVATLIGGRVQWTSLGNMDVIGTLDVAGLANGDRIVGAAFDTANLPAAFYFASPNSSDATMRMVRLGAAPGATATAISIALHGRQGSIAVAMNNDSPRRALATDGRNLWLLPDQPASGGVAKSLQMEGSGEWAVAPDASGGWVATRADSADSSVLLLALQGDDVSVARQALDGMWNISAGAWKLLQATTPNDPKRKALHVISLGSPIPQFEALRFDPGNGRGYSRVSANRPSPEQQARLDSQIASGHYTILDRGGDLDPLVAVWRPLARQLVGLTWPALSESLFTVSATNPRTTFFEVESAADGKSALILGRALPEGSVVTEAFRVSLANGSISTISLGVDATPVIPQGAPEIRIDGWTFPFQISGTANMPVSNVVLWPQLTVAAASVPAPANHDPSEMQPAAQTDETYEIPVILVDVETGQRAATSMKIRAPSEVLSVVAPKKEASSWWLVRNRSGNLVAETNDGSGVEFPLWTVSGEAIPPSGYVSSDTRNPSILFAQANKQGIGLRLFENRGAAWSASECGGLCDGLPRPRPFSRPLIVSSDLGVIGVLTQPTSEGTSGSTASVRGGATYGVQPLPESSYGAVLPYADRPAVWLVPSGDTPWTEIRSLHGPSSIGASTCKLIGQAQ